MNPAEQSARDVHAAYCRITGFEIRPTMDRLRLWHEFLTAGFTADDIQMVTRWIRKQLERSGTGYTPGSLRISTLIGEAPFEIFEEKLAVAKVASVKAKPRPAYVSPVSHEDIAPHEDLAAQFAELAQKLRAP